MKQLDTKKPYSLIKSILIIVFFSAIFYFLTSQKRELPVYNPFDVNPELVDKGLQNIKEGHTIADFKLVNQSGKTITQKDYEDKIYVADFFFTRCQTICPIMTKHMSDLQQEFLNDDQVKLLSMSVTPVMDSIPILKAYADKKGAIEKKWNLTTGDKKHIYNLARKSFMSVLDQGDGGLQDFIHTEQFVLIDKKKQIRGFYDGTNADDIQRLIDDVRLLMEKN